MSSEDLRLRAAHYRDLASSCSEAVARLLLDRCAQDYEAEARREEYGAFALSDRR